MTAGLILAIMITPIVTVDRPRDVRDRAAVAKDAAHALGATRWEMIRAVGVPAQPQRPRRRDPHRPRPRPRRDDRRGARDRLRARRSPPSCSRRAYSLPSVIANQFGEATGDYRSALIGMGVVSSSLTHRHRRRRPGLRRPGRPRMAGERMSARPARPLDHGRAARRRGAGIKSARRDRRRSWLSLFVALVPLVLIVGYVVSRGLGDGHHDRLVHRRRSRSSPAPTGAGMRPAIIGTLHHHRRRDR